MSSQSILLYSQEMEPYPYRLDWHLWQEAAAPFLSGQKKLLSIDWDFFYQPPERGDFPDTLAEMMPGRLAIEEWFSHERSLSRWQEAYEILEVIGFDPREYFRFIDYPSLEEFARLLQDRFLIQDVYIADSHAWGSWASMVAASGETTEVFSFDAHHDCGYWNYYPGDSDLRSQKRARERPSCDDWIQAGIVHDVIEKAHIIYPDGGGREWEMNPPTIPDRYFDKIKMTHFSHWLDDSEGREKEDVVLLLVRSAAYSPPFFSWDSDFLRLASLFGNPTCLDCLAPSGIHIGDEDACQKRL